MEGFLCRIGEGFWNDLESGDWNQNDFLPLLSISQCIEFLGKDWYYVILYGGYGGEIELRNPDKELIDALFDAVKQVLEDECKQK